MKNDQVKNKLRWLYPIGFFVILALPLFNLPPWLYPTDWAKSIIFRSVLTILIFLLLWQFFYKRNEIHLPKIKNNKITWALGLLLAVFFIACIFSVDPYFSFWGSPLRGGGFVTFGFYFIFAILSFILFKKEDWKKAWIFSIFIGILVSLIAIIQFYGLFNNVFVSVGARPGSTIGNPIFLGIYLLLLFFTTLVFAIKEKNRYLKIFYILTLLLFLYTILITGSRATYLGIIAGIACFLLFYPIKPAKNDLSRAKMNWADPKRLNLLKVFLGLFLIFVFLIVLYANIHPQLPQVLQNRVTEDLVGRLSVKRALNDERYRAWKIAVKEILDKPILGWGPENLAVGFDKNFDPKVVSSPWWDKAHNVFLDIGAQTGILGILSYILLFAALFWELHKTKRREENENKKIIINGLQATLVGYLVANFFSFDSFPTYLLFFFIISYSLYLTSSGSGDESQISYKKIRGRGVIMGILFLILIAFLWQYNLVPFQINTKINIADNWTNLKECDSALALMGKITSQHSYLDSYLRIEYVSDIKTCDQYNPQNDLSYAEKGVELLKEAVKIQPLYTRFWIYLGSFTTVIANDEQDLQTKQNLVNEAYSYFDKAETLAPLHQEIFLEEAKTDASSGNYQKMEQDGNKCIEIKSDYGNCYWTKALAELYLNENDLANKNIENAKKYGFDNLSTIALYQLIDVYDKTEQYDKLAGVYKDLILQNPDIAQYHASLAFAYSKLGDYKDARTEAMIFLQMMPSATGEVNAFLQTLPQ